MSELVRKDDDGEILLYQSEDGQSRIECASNRSNCKEILDGSRGRCPKGRPRTG